MGRIFGGLIQQKFYSTFERKKAFLRSIKCTENYLIVAYNENTCHHHRKHQLSPLTARKNPLKISLSYQEDSPDNQFFIALFDLCSQSPTRYWRTGLQRSSFYPLFTNSGTSYRSLSSKKDAASTQRTRYPDVSPRMGTWGCLYARILWFSL